MGSQIYFTDEEIKELLWVIPMYQNLHQDTWGMEEAERVHNIIKKFEGEIKCNK